MYPLFDKNLPKETYGIIKYIKDESNIKLKCSFLLKTEINLLIKSPQKLSRCSIPLILYSFFPNSKVSAYKKIFRKNKNSVANGTKL